MRKRIAATIRQAGTALINVIIPRLCAVCGDTMVEGEDVMCLVCRTSMPLTMQYRRQPNEIHDRLISLRAPLSRATSYMYYHRENSYAKLIHDTKYHGRYGIGRKLAEEHSKELLSTHFFDGIDCIVPIPTHILKFLRRTYNQSEKIARGISDVTGLPVATNLKASKYHSSQTRKTATERKANVASAFKVDNPDELMDKHILLVDDVITTGATMVAAMETLREASPTVSLSVFSLALTK